MKRYAEPKGRGREMEGIHRELEETRFTMERLEIESRSVHENSSYLHNLRFSSIIFGVYWYLRSINFVGSHLPRSSSKHILAKAKNLFSSMLWLQLMDNMWAFLFFVTIFLLLESFKKIRWTWPISEHDHALVRKPNGVEISPFGSVTVFIFIVKFPSMQRGSRS